MKRHASKSSRSEPLQSRSWKVASTGEEGRQSSQFKCPSIQRRINSNTSTSCAMTSTKNKTEFSLLAPVSRPLRHRIASTERSLSSQMLRHWRPGAVGKQRIKRNYRRQVLRLPDLDHCKSTVFNSLGSPASRRVYECAIDHY